jgi:hypothetical protein
MKYQNSIIAIFLIAIISICGYTQQDSKIFWVDQSLHKIQSASLNGTHVTDVLTGLNLPERVAIDTDSDPMKLYFTETGGTRVARCNFDGSNLEDVVTGIDNPEDLELDLANRKVYWLTDLYSTDKVQRADMDGLNSNVEVIYTNNYAMHGFHGIGVDPVHQWIFWTQTVYGSLDRINRINYDGTGRIALGNYLSPRDLELVGNTIYWIWGSEDLIMRANLDGSGVDTVLTGVDGHFFAIDSALGKIYWTESNKIKCANLDNTGHLEVISGLSNTLKGVAIYYNPLMSLSNSENKIPDGFYFAQNYPNPFNPITNIQFHLPHSEFLNLTVYDVLGRQVATLINERLPAGAHETKWNASGLPSGVYFYKLSIKQHTAIRKMLLMK